MILEWKAKLLNAINVIVIISKGGGDSDERELILETSKFAIKRFYANNYDNVD